MSTYAIVETGSKQFKVQKDLVFSVEKLDVEDKKKVELDRVLLVSDGKSVTVGDPTIKGAKVVCDVIEQFKDKKVTSFKFRRRKDSRKKIGHRQPLTRLRVKEIKAA